jgi:Na+/H+-translocating membrane pyrophosphatase
MKAEGKAAVEMGKELRIQFLKIPEILNGKGKIEYDK